MKENKEMKMEISKKALQKEIDSIEFKIHELQKRKEEIENAINGNK